MCVSLLIFHSRSENGGEVYDNGYAAHDNRCENNGADGVHDSGEITEVYSVVYFENLKYKGESAGGKAGKR